MSSRLVSGLFIIGLLFATSIVRDAHAACGSGFRVTVVQNSDIQLTPGAKVYLPIRFITTDLPIPAGGMPYDCGVYARSEVPGLSVVSAYGAFPPTINPNGVWAFIGGASTAEPTQQPWFGTMGSVHVLFSVLADGTTPAGTQGRISLAVNEGGEISVVLRTIGTINVIVGPSSAPTWFSVNSTKRNISAHRVVLDHPLLNGNGGARLFIAHVHNPPGLTPAFWSHPISAHYDGALAKWTINNSDGTIMPAGLGFNVLIDPSATQYYTGQIGRPPVPFVTINDPIANRNPYATIIVGMTTGLATNPHPVAVQYAAPNWRIVNSDGALIPAGVRFNVKVIGFSAYHTSTLVTNTPRIDSFVSNGAGISIDGSSSMDTRLLFFWWQLGRQSLPMIVTRNLSPLGQNVPPEGKYMGLKYVDGTKPQWAVVYEDQSLIPNTAAFNLVAIPQPVVQ